MDAGRSKRSQPASFAGIPEPAHADSAFSSFPDAASSSSLQEVQQQLQAAAQALGGIVNAVPLGPQALYQATESAAQSSQQSVQKALQQVLQLQQQLQQQAAAGAPDLMRQAEKLRAGLRPAGPAPGASGIPSSAPAPAGATAAVPAAAASSAAAPATAPATSSGPPIAEAQPPAGSKEHLESATASQSLHAHEPALPQAVGLFQAAPADDSLNPTSVAEDEVDTIIARTNPADRYTLDNGNL